MFTEMNKENEAERWKESMKLDFEDLGIITKGEDGLKLDVRLDGFRNYEYSQHQPCVYFRVGPWEYDFLPMIICEEPYVPFEFELTISDEELQWIHDWVKINHQSLLRFANEEIGYDTLFKLIKNVP